jgi:acyl-coenzyme A synthetase/AMP-(fatty) acid ligase
MNVTHAFWQQCAVAPDHPAVINSGRTMSYGDVRRMVSKIMHFLVHTQGIVHRDSVMVSLQDPAMHLFVALALARLGATYVSVDPGWSADFRNVIGERHQARLSIRDDSESATPSFPTGRPAVLFSQLLQALRSPASSEELPCAGDGRDIWRVSFSSGTTGLPKSIPWSHAANSKLQDLQTDFFDCNPRSRRFIFADIRVGVGLMSAMMQLRGGGTVIFAPSSSPQEFLTVLQRDRPNGILSTPGPIERAVSWLERSHPEILASHFALEEITLGHRRCVQPFAKGCVRNCRSVMDLQRPAPWLLPTPRPRKLSPGVLAAWSLG